MMDTEAQISSSSTLQPSSNSLALSNTEASAIAGEVPIAKVTREECGDVDPALCLQTLQKMKTLENWSQLMKNLPKKLPDSYKAFEKLSSGQHLILKSIIITLPSDIKTEMIRRISLGSTDVRRGAQRAPNTTKHELARLIELRVHPAAQRHWFNAYSPQSRAELDANLRSEENLNNPNKVYWNKLAEIFNNRDTEESNDFRPQNIVCDYTDECTKKEPYSNANPELYSEDVFELLQELEPNERQGVVRDGEWVKEQMAGLRRELAVPYSNWSSSGNQNGDMGTKHGIDEFILKYATSKTDPIKYMFIRMDKIFLDACARDMGNEGHDSGLMEDDDEGEDDRDNSSSASSRRKVALGKEGKSIYKKSHQRNAQRKRKKQRCGSPRSEDGNSTISVIGDSDDDEIDSYSKYDENMAKSFGSIAQSLAQDSARQQSNLKIDRFVQLMKHYGPDSVHHDEGIFKDLERKWLAEMMSDV